MRLHVKLDELRERDWLGLMEMQRQQLQLLGTLLERLELRRDQP